MVTAARLQAIKKKSYQKHRAKRNANTRKYYKQNPDVARNFHYQKKYGISIEKYDELLAAQEDKCKCCGEHKSKQKQRLSVDHDHKTGEIRGLLCFRCNRLLIGQHRDPELLRKGASYLDGPFTGLFVPKKVHKRKR